MKKKIEGKNRLDPDLIMPEGSNQSRPEPNPWFIASIIYDSRSEKLSPY